MTTSNETSIVKQPDSAPAPERQAAEPKYHGPVVTPRYHVAELEDGAQVRVSLPGIEKSSVETTVEHNRLVIKARQTWTVPETWAIVHRESKCADYQLALELDPSLDQSNVTADLVNGVLKVSIAKHKALKPRRIEITN